MEKEGRMQRYLLMSQVCRENRTRSVVVAHHGDDQIETFLMRWLFCLRLTNSLYRGSGYAGLACMKPVQEMDDGTRRIRPLLPVSKERLLATCRESSIPYVIDPSNQDLQYDRNRIRAAVSEIKERELMDVSRLLRAADFFQLVCVGLGVDAQIRNAVEGEIHQRLEECCEYNRELGICRLNADALCALSDPSCCVHALTSSSAHRVCWHRWILDALGEGAASRHGHYSTGARTEEADAGGGVCGTPRGKE